jgi:hypothetical protein
VTVLRHATLFRDSPRVSARDIQPNIIRAASTRGLKSIDVSS